MSRRHFALFSQEDRMDDAKFAFNNRDAHITSHAYKLNARRASISPRRGKLEFEHMIKEFLESEICTTEQVEEVTELLEDE